MKNPIATFADIAARWPTSNQGQHAFWDADLSLSAFLTDLFSPERRHWFEACVHELRLSGLEPLDHLKRAESLVPQLPLYLRSGLFVDPFLRTHAKAHLSVCKALILHKRQMANPDESLASSPNQFLQKELGKVAKDANISPRRISRLSDEMRQAASEPKGSTRPCITLTVPVVEIVGKDAKGEDVTEGSLATLKLELHDDGRGQLYPSPAMAFIKLDRDFVRGGRNAGKYVREKEGIWRGHGDVLWTLTRAGKPLPLEIVGPSAGAGFALAMAALLSGRGEGNSRYA